MNRNVESHFSMLPSANISRSRFDRSQDVLMTGDAGKLLCFFCDEVLPGDTFDVTTSKIIRAQTMLKPIFGNIYADTYWFFVPNRLVWSHWRELMGENTQSAWIPEVEYSVPQIRFESPTSDKDNLAAASVQTGDILDYMGIPVGVCGVRTDETDPTSPFPEGAITSVSALPYRSYQLVWNEFFRSEAIQDPLNIQTGDSDYQYITMDSADKKPLPVDKYFDYFTSCLPSPQKGPPVSVPSTFNASIVNGWPVVPRGIYNTETHGWLGPENVPNDEQGGYVTLFRKYDGSVENISDADLRILGIGKSSTSTSIARAGNAFGSSLTNSDAHDAIYLSNLYASPAMNQVSGLSIDVNDLRYAFQLQKLYERDARGGTRYVELLASHFGVMNPDARLQRPEYLGGNRISISIHQITNQSQGENDFLGDLGAMSITTDKHRDFVKSFTEHGTLLGLICIRYEHQYAQALNKMWTRKQRFDYYWPVFANLGEQAVHKSELMWTADSSDSDVFGYQERWAEYRYLPNKTVAEMRPGIANTLDSWHLADYYEEVPTLSDSWLVEDKTNIDRVLAVTSEVSNQFFADIYVKNYTTRPMPLYSIPGLIDHH